MRGSEFGAFNRWRKRWFWAVLGLELAFVLVLILAGCTAREPAGRGETEFRTPPATWTITSRP